MVTTERQLYSKLPKLRRPNGWAAAFFVALLAPMFFNDDVDIDAAGNALAFATLALGLNIVIGMAGLLDLGFAAFFAIGAYSYGVAASWQITPEWSPLWEPAAWLGLVSHIQSGGVDLVHFNVSFWLMLPVSALLAALMGVAFGAPTLRLRGDYLAIVTLGFGEIVPIVARNSPEITNGAMGLNAIAPPSLFGFSFGIDPLPFYYLGLALLTGVVISSLRLQQSRIGRAWMAIREDEIAARTAGINSVALKLLAFATGAAIAGATGAFYVSKLQTAAPEMFMFPVSVMLLVMVVFGGMGSVAGVVVGAIVLQMMQSRLLPELSGVLHSVGSAVNSDWLQRIELSSATELIFGLILVIMMLYRREGLIPVNRRQAVLSLDEQTADVRRGGFPAIEVLRPSPYMGGAMLSVRGLSKNFGGLVALRNVEFDVEPGTVVGIIGPNGSGKSTLFNIISGIEKPSGGTIQYLGEDIAGLAAHQIMERGLARTFQNIRLFSNLTVYENVLVGTHSRTRTGLFGAVLRTPRAKREADAVGTWTLELIAAFGNRLRPRVAQIVSHLSYANRRRVEIARALASRPRFLLLDEPTAGMNPVETMELADQIRSLHELGMTILVIEHKLDFISALAEKVIVLDHGEKIAEGSAEAVQQDSKVIEAYLGRSVRVAA